MAFERNEHEIDRIVRAVVGVAAGVGAFMVGFSGVWGWLLAVVGVIMLGTAAVGFCPLYRIFGISTCAVPQQK